MLKEIIPPKEAIALKELGFAEESLWYYIYNPLTGRHGRTPCRAGEEKFARDWNNTHLSRVTAPLWQQVFRWLRDKKGIVVEICYLHNRKTHIPTVTIIRDDTATEVTFPGGTFDTWESAELAALQKAIKLLQDGISTQTDRKRHEDDQTLREEKEMDAEDEDNQPEDERPIW